MACIFNLALKCDAWNINVKVFIPEVQTAFYARFKSEKSETLYLEYRAVKGII